MIKIHFTSAECYPAAKVGGLADVVGSLPKYLNLNEDAQVQVFMPYYDLPFFKSEHFNSIHEGFLEISSFRFPYQILHYTPDNLGYDLFGINIPDLFYRKGVYADEHGDHFEDQVLRYISFQRVYLDFIRDRPDHRPAVLHCHDHHMGLTPFMIANCYTYEAIKHIPTVFTIHNERYQGVFSWESLGLIPRFDTFKGGLLEWDGLINPLASGVKSAWKVTTVSPQYMKQLQQNPSNLVSLFQSESHKSLGILNGIDYDVWDPKKDDFLKIKLKSSVPKFKKDNKAELLSLTKLDPSKPLVSFIGRFVGEKGVDVLASSMFQLLNYSKQINFIILGTGDPNIEHQFRELQRLFPENVHAELKYDEGLAHRIYAGADYLMMPSRVEPCGLNQMYAMRYGTIPVVNSTGGLIDTVHDAWENGTGIRFSEVSEQEILHAFSRIAHMEIQQEVKVQVIKNAMKSDHDWKSSSNQYMNIYKKLI